MPTKSKSSSYSTSAVCEQGFGPAKSEERDTECIVDQLLRKCCHCLSIRKCFPLAIGDGTSYSSKRIRMCRYCEHLLAAWHLLSPRSDRQAKLLSRNSVRCPSSVCDVAKHAVHNFMVKKVMALDARLAAFKQRDLVQSALR